MKKIEEKELDNIYGGTTNSISSTMINAIINVVKVLEEGGIKVGSSIRRLTEGHLCPLE